MFYKKRICKPDTATDIAERTAYRAAAEQANAERKTRWPQLTAENFDDAEAWQKARLAELTASFASEDRENDWRKTYD